MDAQIGLARALVPLTVALHVRIPGDHPSVATLLRFGRVRDRGRRAWIGFYPQPTVSGIEVAGEDRAEFYR